MTRARELAELAAAYDSGGLSNMKNRIINGNMVIDQRNAGAAVTVADAFVVDRWRIYHQSGSGSKGNSQQNAGSVTPPAGFVNYIGFTTTSAYSVGASDGYGFQQRIEGFNVADLGWGTANAQAVTISFWVRSSLTGSFGGSLTNGSGRSYPFSYTISSANTWEQKTLTVPGDTSGTWPTNNSAAILLTFGLGVGSNWSGTAGAWTASTLWSATGATSVVGTNGATFYITGVQLEKGSTATSFDYRPYGTELQLCYRYYYRNKASNTSSYFGVGLAYATTNVLIYSQFPVSMRTTPSALEQTGTATDYRVMSNSGGGVTCSSAPTFNSASTEAASTTFTVASGVTAGNASFSFSNAGANAYLAWSAEL